MAGARVQSAMRGGRKRVVIPLAAAALLASAAPATSASTSDVAPADASAATGTARTSPAQRTRAAAIPGPTALGGTGHSMEQDLARGLLYVSLSDTGEILAIDPATATITKRTTIGGTPQRMDLGADGDTLYVAMRDAGSVVRVDVSTWTVLGTDDVSAALGDLRAYDVEEISATRIAVSADPGSSGASVLVEYDPANPAAAASMAGGRIIRATPTFIPDPGGTYLYVGEDFSPNSLYKLDLSQAGAPIVLEDAHGSVGGTPRATITSDGSRIILGSGQVLDPATFQDATTIGAGYPAVSPDGSRATVVGSPYSSSGDLTTYALPSFAVQSTAPWECPGSSSVLDVEVSQANDVAYLLTSGSLCIQSLTTTIATITGTVADASTSPLSGMCVQAQQDDGTVDGLDFVSVLTTSGGAFSIEVEGGLPYVVWAADCAQGFYDYAFAGGDDTLTATRFTPAAGGTAAVGQIVLRESGAFAGVARHALTGERLAGIYVDAIDVNGFFTPWRATTDETGLYYLTGLRDSVEYTMLFSDPQNRVSAEYFGDASSFAAAATTSITAGFVRVALSPDLGAFNIARYRGDDRYGTAADLVSDSYWLGADVVFVTSGLNYPDALAIGPLAAIASVPVLLVDRDVIPAATATELARLGPKHIIIVGGVGAVSTAVEGALSAYASESVERLSGRRRADTAALIATTFFDTGLKRVYIATELNYPDALGATPAAAIDGAPILLAGDHYLPAATADALKQLAPSEVIVVGGAGSIDDTVLHTIQLYSGVTPMRIAGSNRYATAAAITAFAFPGELPHSTIWVTSGEDFPDALIGGALAGTYGIPLLLVNADGIPAETAAELRRLDPGFILVLGGTGTLPVSVSEALIAYAH